MVGPSCYLSDVLEAVQRRALRIIFPHADYNTALCSAGLGSLADRRDAICAKFISKAKPTPPLSCILTNPCIINHVSYDHRSYERNLSNCVQKPEKVRTSTGFEPVTSQFNI